MKRILHVTPVMPVDERHIELALDTAGVPGTLTTHWLPRHGEHRLLRALPFQRFFRRREPIELVQRRLLRSFVPDVRRSYRIATGHPSVTSHDELFHTVDTAAAREVDGDTAAVIGREGACLRAFREGKRHGAMCIHHMPIAHHETMQPLFRREQGLFGDICVSTFDPMEFGEARLADKTEELRLADRVWCPSRFVKDSLVAAGMAADRIGVIPFGGESAWLKRPRPKPDGTFLLVGNVSARKGAHRLLKAWKALGAHRTHRLVLIGAMHLTPAFLADYRGLYEHVPRLPREELASRYLHASALALPSLAEGFALVILEALSCGTPALVSRNSGAEGFLKEDEEARLFDAADDEALGAALEWALSHPSELEEMGRCGRHRAAAWPWDKFENGVLDELRALNLP